MNYAELMNKYVQLEQDHQELKWLCAQMYQAAGAYNMPVRVLDALSDAANGDPIRNNNILPISPDEGGAF